MHRTKRVRKASGGSGSYAIFALVAVALLVGAGAYALAGSSRGSSAKTHNQSPKKGASYDDVEAIRSEADNLEAAMLAAWESHGKQWDKAMSWEDRERLDPRSQPDVRHHKEAVASIVWRIRLEAVEARDLILNQRIEAAANRISSMRESLLAGWRHQGLWKDGRAQ